MIIMKYNQPWSIRRESSKLNTSLARTLLCDAFQFFRGRSAETVTSFVQINIELFETLKVLAAQPGYVFQFGYLGLT